MSQHPCPIQLGATIPATSGPGRVQACHPEQTRPRTRRAGQGRRVRAGARRRGDERQGRASAVPRGKGQQPWKRTTRTRAGSRRLRARARSAAAERSAVIRGPARRLACALPRSCWASPVPPWAATSRPSRGSSRSAAWRSRPASAGSRAAVRLGPPGRGDRPAGGLARERPQAELVALRSQMNKMGGRLPEGDLRARSCSTPTAKTTSGCNPRWSRRSERGGINQHGGYARALIPCGWLVRSHA